MNFDCPLCRLPWNDRRDADSALEGGTQPALIAARHHLRIRDVLVHLIDGHPPAVAPPPTPPTPITPANMRYTAPRPVPFSFGTSLHTPHPGEVATGTLGGFIRRPRGGDRDDFLCGWVPCGQEDDYVLCSRCFKAQSVDAVRATGDATEGAWFATQHVVYMTPPGGIQRVEGGFLSPATWPESLLRRLIDQNPEGAIVRDDSLRVYRFGCGECKTVNFVPLPIEKEVPA